MSEKCIIAFIDAQHKQLRCSWGFGIIKEPALPYFSVEILFYLFMAIFFKNLHGLYLTSPSLTLPMCVSMSILFIMNLRKHDTRFLFYKFLRIKQLIVPVVRDAAYFSKLLVMPTVASNQPIKCIVYFGAITQEAEL